MGVAKGEGDFINKYLDLTAMSGASISLLVRLRLSVCLSVYSFVSLSVCLFISLCLSACLSLSMCACASLCVYLTVSQRALCLILRKFVVCVSPRHRLAQSTSVSVCVV